MALFINGVGQDTFNMNGVSIDNLYVDGVLVWSSAVLPIAPNAPTNFVASDDEVEQITFSWTNSTIGNPTPTYDIYISGGALVVSGVTSPHTESIVAGTEDYIVRAVNSEGTADSNIDSGTSISGIIDAPPIYELTEALVGELGYDYLVDSSDSSIPHNARLVQSDGTTFWSPTAQEYPGDETAVIDFGTNKALTGWATTDADPEFTLSFVDNVDGAGNYRLVSIHSKSDGLSGDVYYNGVLDPKDTNLIHTSSIQEIVIEENMYYYLVPVNPTCVITLDNYALTTGETVAITFEFNTMVDDLSLGDISADNAVVSNLVQDSISPWLWTATLTPNVEINSATNAVTLASGSVRDQWHNASLEAFTSPNYTVDTVTSQNREWYIAFSGGQTITTPMPSGIFINDIDGAVINPEISMTDKDSVSDGTFKYAMYHNSGGGTNGLEQGDNTGILYDRQQENYQYRDVYFLSRLFFADVGTYVIRDTICVDGTITPANVRFRIASNVGDVTFPEADEQFVVGSNNLTEYAEWTITVTVPDSSVNIYHGISNTEAGYSSGISVKEQ